MTPERTFKNEAKYHYSVRFRGNSRSRGGPVGIGTRLRGGRPGFDFRQGQGIFLFATEFRPALGTTQPPIHWVQVALSLGIKRQRREADH